MARSTPANPQEIEEELSQLTSWKVVERAAEDFDHTRVELHRLFQFRSFGDAMHFMLTASRFIEMTDHHPSWMNAYAKVEVWITTGELKHRLSEKDFRLARYLEDLFAGYGLITEFGD